MKTNIDKSSQVPLYQQVKAYLNEYIRTQGRHSRQLPPENQICRDYGISRPTVRMALNDLVKEGLIERIPGKGTFIKERNRTLIFANWQASEKCTQQPLENLLERFSSFHSGIHITSLPMEYEHLRDQLMVMAGGGNAPDIAALLYLWIPFLANQGALLPLDDLYTPELCARCLPESLKAVHYNDHYYGLNWVNGPTMLFHNKRLLREFGSVETLQVDYYDELLEHFIRIDERSRHSIIPFVLGITNDDVFYIYSIYPLLLSFSGGVIDQEGEIIFNSQANIDAFKWLKSFIAAGKVNTLIDFREARRLFANGQVAFLMDGPWVRSIFPTLNNACSQETEEIGFSTLPRTPSGLSYSVLGNHVLSIFQQCEDKEAAIEFLKFLALDRDVAAMYYRQTGMLPSLADEVETNPLYDDEFGRVQREQLKVAKAIPDSHPAFSLSVGFCAKACREILIGDADIQSTLNNTSTIIRELYRREMKPS